MSPGRGLGFAAASGACATAALLLSPQGSQVPPLLLPYTLVDLRFVGLPLLFASAHLAARRARWPWPALALVSLALLAATAAHVQGSALLGLFTRLDGSAPGERVPLVATFAAGGSLLLALAAGLDRAADRLARAAREAGIPPESLAPLARQAEAQAARTLGFAGAAFAALALAARAGDVAAGGAQAPLPELLGAGLAVGVAVLLFPGALRARAAHRNT